MAAGWIDRVRTLLFLALAVLAALVVLRLFMPRLVPRFVFFPEPLRPQESAPRYWGHGDATELRFPSDDGVLLHAWWFPSSSRTRHCGTAIYLHGNAGHIGDRGPVASGLAGLGFDVLLPDYRGYGLSEGKPSEEGLYRDALGAYRFVTEERGATPDRLLLIGNSLGAAVATDLAARRPVGGLALLGVFTSTLSVARRAYPWMPDWVFEWDKPRFDVLSRLDRLTAPLLVVAGREDRVISPEEGRAVFEAAPEPKAWVEIPNAGHNDLFAREELWQVLHQFSHEVLACREPEPSD